MSNTIPRVKTERDVYILCGANAVSGGAELAHQLCSAINRLTECRAKICYVDLSVKVDQSLPTDVIAEPRYDIYGTEHVKTIQEMDRKQNVVIIPEGLTLSIVNIQYARIVIWWMSVDNYFAATMGSDFDLIKRRSDLHLVQSYYAKKFVEDRIPGIKTMWLTDYIREEHGAFLYPAEFRENIVLYNPAKGYEVTKRIMDHINTVRWVPLSGRSVEEMIVLMQASKLYVDFGNHPGRDRIPREAAANGCCIISNKAGSACFYEDVPIPDQYKFEDPEKDILKLEALINSIFASFSEHQKEFTEYREWIKADKCRFENEVRLFVDEIEADQVGG